MEEFIKSDLEFIDERLQTLILELKTCFENKQNNFCKICETIYSIWSYCKGNYWKAKDNEYYNSYKLLAKFGFDKKAVSRYKLCYERYVHVESCSLFALYEDFTPSKLFELLVLSDETAKDLIVKELIKPTMTVKEIREYIKTIKDGTDKAEKVIEETIINEEEIPMAYDPKQEYEYTYFESKTKNQLLNIVWELQKAYQKLKKSKEKK